MANTGTATKTTTPTKAHLTAAADPKIKDLVVVYKHPDGGIYTFDVKDFKRPANSAKLPGGQQWEVVVTTRSAAEAAQKSGKMPPPTASSVFRMPVENPQRSVAEFLASERRLIPSSIALNNADNWARRTINNLNYRQATRGTMGRRAATADSNDARANSGRAGNGSRSSSRNASSGYETPTSPTGNAKATNGPQATRPQGGPTSKTNGTPNGSKRTDGGAWTKRDPINVGRASTRKPSYGGPVVDGELMDEKSFGGPSPANRTAFEAEFRPDTPTSKPSTREPGNKASASTSATASAGKGPGTMFAISDKPHAPSHAAAAASATAATKAAAAPAAKGGAGLA